MAAKPPGPMDMHRDAPDAAGGAIGRPADRVVHTPKISTESGSCFCCTGPLATCLCLVFPCAICCSCRVIQPRHAAVGTVYGEYLGTWTTPGLFCINPCGLELAYIRVNNRALELQAMKCVDKLGNSLIVSGVVTFNVIDPAKAVLDMTNVEEYCHLQAQAVMKRVCSQYPFVTWDGSPSLITEQALHLGEQLRGQLQAAVDVAGVQVVSFQLSDLAYAPEIASQMLVRQQAQATIDARKTIVAGAVGIVSDALAELAERGNAVPAEDRGRFVSNMMTVLCADKAPVPTVGV